MATAAGAGIPEVIEFYSRSKNAAYLFLSNFFEAPIEVDGKRYVTVEHYFQAAKFFDTDPAYAETVRTSDKPRDAKRLGQSRAHAIHPSWEKVKEDFMRTALRAKFTQNSKLKSGLMGSGSAKLVEAAPGDNYWGAGAGGKGLNRLGCLLMELRSDLRSASE
jgi:ribA/ribD-fused uncharacterized protein